MCISDGDSYNGLVMCHYLAVLLLLTELVCEMYLMIILKSNVVMMDF